jgi:hypothetical protein
MTSIWDNASHLRSMPLPKVREKLSNLVRRGSTRKLRATATGHDGVPTVAPVLEVDLTRVESFRLAEGWLEDPNAQPPSPKRRDGPRGRRGDGARGSDHREPKPAQRYSTTPIADLFSMSTDQLASTLETIARKPVPAPAPRVMPETWSVAPPSTTAPAAGVAASRTRTTKRESIPDASVGPDLQPVRISLRHSTVVDAVVAPEATSSTLSRRRTVMSWSNVISAGPPASSAPEESSQRHSVRETSLLRSVGPNTTGLRVTGGGNGGGSSDGAKRFSMPPMQPPAELHFVNPLLVPEVKAALPTPTRNASTPTPTSTPTLTAPSPAVRRRSWQPAAPAPTSPGVVGLIPRRTRPPSAAPTSSRLAWIRELENKPSSSGTPRPELQRLGLQNSGGGGVAGRLAMFEQIQKQQQQQKQLAPSAVSRSSSTTSSRASSGVTTDSVFAASASVIGDYPPSTARTSMDSTRSHRNSAVMAYYDEEFREKMEGVAGGLSKQLSKGEEESASGSRKATARWVEGGEAKKSQKEGQPSEIAAIDYVSSETAKGEQREARAEEQQAVAPANDEVESAKEEVVPEALELPMAAEELSIVKGDPCTPLEADVSEAPLADSGDSALATVIAVDEPDTQPANTADDAPAAVTTEVTRTDSEEKPKTENPPSPNLASIETRQSLVIVDMEEVTDELAQGSMENVAREEVVEAQSGCEEQDPEGAQGCSSVVGKDEVGVAVELVAQRQDAAVSGVEAER